MGGTKGFHLKPGAASKYCLTAEYRTMYLRELRDVIDLGDSKLAHPDLQRSRIREDKADVESLGGLKENSWLNPMCSEETELVSLSTGTAAPADVAKDLLGAHQIREEAYQMFKKKRLEEAPPTTKFHDKMTKQNLDILQRKHKESQWKRNSQRGGPEGGEKCIWPYDPCCSE